MDRLSKRYSHLFGWSEQNFGNWGIERIEFDLVPSEDGVTFLEGGLLDGNCIPSGDWFVTFAEAKKAAVDYWRDRISTAKRALSSVRGTRLKDFKK